MVRESTLEVIEVTITDPCGSNGDPHQTPDNDGQARPLVGTKEVYKIRK